MSVINQHSQWSSDLVFCGWFFFWMHLRVGFRADILTQMRNVVNVVLRVLAVGYSFVNWPRAT